MTEQKALDEILKSLGLSEVDAAEFLGVSVRTVKRWRQATEEIPGPALRALEACVRLHRHGLSWRPSEAELAEIPPSEVSDYVGLHRAHVLDLDGILQRVDARGGPSRSWSVDPTSGTANLGALTITFYHLRSGSFSPSTYSRTDGVAPDLVRDRALIEDGIASIAAAFRLSPSPAPPPSTGDIEHDRRIRLQAQMAALQYGSSAHLFADGPFLDLMTELAKKGAIRGISVATAEYCLVHPRRRGMVVQRVPPKIWNHYILGVPGVDPLRCLPLMSDDVWTGAIEDAVADPDRLERVVKDLIGRVKGVQTAV